MVESDGLVTAFGGRLAERSKAMVLKTIRGASSSQVRILHLPPRAGSRLPVWAIKGREKPLATKNFLPAKLIGYEAYQFSSDARRREKFLKTTEGRRLLHQQYRDVIESENLEKD